MVMKRNFRQIGDKGGLATEVELRKSLSIYTAEMIRCLWRYPLEEHSLWHRMIRSKDGGADSGRDTKPLLRRSNRIPSKNVCQAFHLYWDEQFRLPSIKLEAVLFF